jgi:bacterioferritin-associated ferredoxin
VLADKAFREAVNDYFRKSDQLERIKGEKVEVVDKILKITTADIEHAVLEGALDFEAVQRKTKVGIHDKACIPQVKELIEKYKEKYYGEE